MKTIKLTENGVEVEYQLTPIGKDLEIPTVISQCGLCKEVFRSFEEHECKPKLEVWRPKDGEYVYVISPDGEIKKWVYYTYNNWCDYRCFKTKEQAIEAHEKALFNYEVEMFIKEKNEGWVPDFGFGLNLDEEELDCIYSLNEGYRGVFVDSEIEIRNKSYSKYFKTKEIGEEIISKFDNEKLIKWWI